MGRVQCLVLLDELDRLAFVGRLARWVSVVWLLLLCPLISALGAQGLGGGSGDLCGQCQRRGSRIGCIGRCRVF